MIKWKPFQRNIIRSQNSPTIPTVKTAVNTDKSIGCLRYFAHRTNPALFHKVEEVGTGRTFDKSSCHGISKIHRTFAMRTFRFHSPPPSYFK